MKPTLRKTLKYVAVGGWAITLLSGIALACVYIWDAFKDVRITTKKALKILKILLEL